MTTPDLVDLAAQVDALRKEIDERHRQPLRLEVAKAKGLPERLAKRLQGSTREELEADADELLALFGETGGDGADRDEDEEDDEFDPEKVVDHIRRGF